MTSGRRERIGVAVGKFNPPHLGHLHLIETGAAEVDHLYVLLCDRADQSLDVDDRRRWLVDASPDNVTIVVTPDDLPEANEPWAERALELLPRSPDVAFTSEPWGPGWADLMGADHRSVDEAREHLPISATALRADLGKHFEWLVPAARADLARRVVLVGAESTGKTTLASALAAELGTVWVPEHGRWYWEGRHHLDDQTWTTDEFRRIAISQRSLERDLARRARSVVVSDTDALVTSVWHERYLGTTDPELDRMIEPPDLYLICCPDFEWVQDGTRESAAERNWMHERTVERVAASGTPSALLTGSPDERLATAIEHVRPLLTFPPLV
jgi:HTH-type transcriptional regulator, transcriptional repressor of NAD biosynthesis genes